MYRLKRFIAEAVVKALLRLPERVLARLVRRMVVSGRALDACLLENGCLPMLVHYYSPVPNIEDLETRKVWGRISELAGVDFNEGDQLRLLQGLGRSYGRECDWPAEEKDAEGGFFTENGTFAYGCAASTHCMIRHYRPRRIVEIGSGRSSRVIAAAMQRNSDAGEDLADYTIVDPYPNESLLSGLPESVNVVRQPVETLDVCFFDNLREGDVLFVDSGHTVRIGGDVNYLVLDVLPRLSDGVVVHFHDIPMPHEYAKAYCVNAEFRVFWTESYLLQAFLACNRDFEVLLAMNHLQKNRRSEFCDAFPLYDSAVHIAGAGSFWIRRVRGNPADAGA